MLKKDMVFAIPSPFNKLLSILDIYSIKQEVVPPQTSSDLSKEMHINLAIDTIEIMQNSMSLKSTLHEGAFCPFFVRWGSTKSVLGLTQ